MKKIFTLCFLLIFAGAIAQEPVFTIGSQRSMSALNNPEAITFRIGTNNYVLFKKFSMSEGMLLHLEGFSDPTDGFLCSQDIEIPHVPNEVAIYEGFVALSDRMILFRSVFNKDEKKSVLYAHELDQKGMVKDAAGKAITFTTAERAMNSGDFKIKASADGKNFVVLSEYPFTKEMKEKFAVSVFDASLKQLWTKEIELAHDSRRGPQNDPSVSNLGVVYVVKKVEGPKNADFYTVYTVSENGNKTKESVVEMEAPKKIVNYGYTIDEASSDLIFTGYYTEDGKVTLGGTGFKGYFTSRISSASGDIVSKTVNPFDKTQSNLRVISVINLKGNTFLIGEERSENNLSTEQKDSKGFPVYNREFVADKVHVSVFDASGKNIITHIIDKTNKSIEDGGFANSFGVAVVGDQLMFVYNDYQYKHDGQVHKVVGPGLASVKIPVIQFIGSDGATGKKFALIDSNVGGKRGTVFLCPELMVPVSGKEFFFLAKESRYFYPLRMKLP
jgi:hypothetical protein